MDSSLNAIGQITKQLLSRSLPSTESARNDLMQDTQDILQGRIDRLSISALGKKINQLYGNLQSTGSEDALSAFRNFMVELTENPDNMDTLNFVSTTEKLNEAGEEISQQTFETLGQVQEAGANDRSWVRNLEQMDSSQIEEYMGITQSILEREEEGRAEVVDQLSSTISTINQSQELSDEEKGLLVDKLLSGVKQNSSLTDIEEYIQNFREENF